MNPGTRDAEITIAGRDDQGRAAGGGEVSLNLLAGASRFITSQDLESGGSGLRGSFGDGHGKWQLFISASQPIRVLSLMTSPTGHLTNLSTSPFLTSSQVNCSDAVTSGDDHGNTRFQATDLILVRRETGIERGSESAQIEEGDDVDYFEIELDYGGGLTVYTTGSLDTVGTLGKLQRLRAGFR